MNRDANRSSYSLVRTPKLPAAAGAVFLVYLTQNGGANGDDGSTTTAAYPTYTYDVFADPGKRQKLATAAGVLWNRQLMIAVTPGTHGLATYGAGNAVILISVDEYPGQGDCS